MPFAAWSKRCKRAAESPSGSAPTKRGSGLRRTPARGRAGRRHQHASPAPKTTADRPDPVVTHLQVPLREPAWPMRPRCVTHEVAGSPERGSGRGSREDARPVVDGLAGQGWGEARRPEGRTGRPPPMSVDHAWMRYGHRERVGTESGTLSGTGSGTRSRTTSLHGRPIEVRGPRAQQRTSNPSAPAATLLTGPGRTGRHQPGLLRQLPARERRPFLDRAMPRPARDRSGDRLGSSLRSSAAKSITTPRVAPQVSRRETCKCVLAGSDLRRGRDRARNGTF